MRRLVVPLLGILIPVVAVISLVGMETSNAVDAGAAQPVTETCPDAAGSELGETSLAWDPIFIPLPPTTCGGNVCGPGQYCCNQSCGTCVNLGDYCTQEYCPPTS